MKHKTRLSNLQKRTRLLCSTTLFFSLTFLFIGCERDQRSITTVYGTITDHNRQPVDSILVVVKGVDNVTYEELREIYSNENGNYEMVLDVSRKFDALSVLIPFRSKTNPKYGNNYSGFYVSKNGEVTTNCCFATIGEKTKYDFQLIPK